MSTEATTAWTRADLDKMSCTVPGCKTQHHHGPLFLHAKCHPKQPAKVHYRHGGVIELQCSKCDKHILSVRVAPEVQEEKDAKVLACGNPNCTEPPENHSARLRGCHRNAGLWVVYSDGKLTMACGKCKAPVETIAVKPASTEA